MYMSSALPTLAVRHSTVPSPPPPGDTAPARPHARSPLPLLMRIHYPAKQCPALLEPMVAAHSHQYLATLRGYIKGERTTVPASCGLLRQPSGSLVFLGPVVCGTPRHAAPSRPPRHPQPASAATPRLPLAPVRTAPEHLVTRPGSRGDASTVSWPASYPPAHGRMGPARSLLDAPSPSGG